MARFIPVKRPDGSEVASEQGVSNLGGGKSLADIVTSLGAKTLANIFEAVTDLKGPGSKTLTDVVTSLGSKTLGDIFDAVGGLKGAGSKTLTDVVSASDLTTDAVDSLKGIGSKTLTDVVTSLGSKTLANIFDAVTDLKGVNGKTLTDVVASLGAKTLEDVFNSVADLKGVGSKTLTDVVSSLAGLPTSLGAKLSSASLSVTPATDAVVVVAGKAAVGSAPTANPVGVSGIDDSGLQRALLTDTRGRLQPGDLPVLTNTGTIGSISGGATLAIPTGYKTAEAWLTTGNLSASVVIFFSFDGGSTYPAQGTAKRLDTASAVNGLVITGTNVVGKAIRATIPVGATHARVGVSAYTSGSSDAVIALTGAAHTMQVTADAVLGSSVARAGFMARPGTWTRESTTPVNANQIISGAAKTTYSASSGTSFAASNSYGDKFAAAAGSDVAGTLVIDASPDSGTTWYPVASIALAQVGGSGNFGAYLETPICEATMRARLVNGASNQTRAFLTTRMLG